MNGWVYTFHQIGFVPTELNMVSDGFNLDFSPHQIWFILMISNLFGRQVEFMLMISNLLSLSTWIYYVIFTGDLNFYSNWLPSDDYNFLDVIHQIDFLLVNMDGLMVLGGWKNGFIWIDGLYCSLNWLHTQWKNSAWWFQFWLSQQVRFILMISNWLSHQVGYILMISNLLHSSSWNYSNVSQVISIFYSPSNWLHSRDFNF